MNPLFNHVAHEKMWNWIASLNEPPIGFTEGSLNEFWLQANGYGQMKNDCFACQYALEKTTSGDCICVNCPLEWGENKYCLHPDGNTLYEKLNASEMFSTKRRELSLIIATLPVKEGVELLKKEEDA